jgi:hypothetical protein
MLFRTQRSPESDVVIKLYHFEPTTPRITHGLQADVRRTLLSGAPPPTPPYDLI